MRTYTEKKSREQNDLKNHFVTAPFLTKVVIIVYEDNEIIHIFQLIIFYNKPT